MAVKRRWPITAVALLLVTITACSNAELEDAQAQIEELESSIASLEGTADSLEADKAALEADLEAVEEDLATIQGENAALEETVASQGQELILQADIVGEGCMLQSAYLNDGEAKATFRVRVYDPLTGEQLDDEALESVTVTIDGQEFDLSWGPHPPDTENDFFWTYGWEIFEDYPAGNVEYSITATATDGRTGEFDKFNVAPSLLTVMSPSDVES